MKFVSHERLQDHLRLGWLVSLPNGPMHHHVYGCELAWICDCPVPGGFKAYRRRVYVSEASQNEEKHEHQKTAS